ncbi:hypothetical protein AR158_c557L [Paramecium bursaria Chlorella virus AR158]|uniref:hypothetical protein n=1 Tax=Paramecium bursaria Chlorella virus AR158 TaxID=380598 RepID=UPI00015AA765|nr:hypothetical protein AR158_c557L [Paramecium bursaria Chlorella virus AR158]ABU44102.1 hypothetical protein AR158_c557L [Paramecium bursaria Chlorella virus AR158]
MFCVCVFQLFKKLTQFFENSCILSFDQLLRTHISLLKFTGLSRCVSYDNGTWKKVYLIIQECCNRKL